MLMLCCSAALFFAPIQPEVTPPHAAAAMYSSSGSQQIDINLPSLKYYCDGPQRDLKRYVEASPRWRVGVEQHGGRDITVAYRRLNSRITMNGYVGYETQTRVGFVFEEQPTDPERMVPCITQVVPDAGATQVSICSYRLIPSRRLASLYVGVPNLWLSIFESDTTGTLSRTPGLLGEVEAELAAVRKATLGGDPLSALSPADTHKGAPTLTIDDSECTGLDIEAWINPGAPGVTELRVKSGDGSKAFSISHAHRYARERAGYSDDPAQLFFANSKVCINELATGWDTRHDVLFELWFTPDSGGAARKLVERRQVICGWER